MDLFDKAIESKVKRNIIKTGLAGRFDLAVKHISNVIDELYGSIPDKKRISYGIFSVIKSLGAKILECLSDSEDQVLSFAQGVFAFGEDVDGNDRHKGVALRVLALWAIKEGNDPKDVLFCFEQAAISEIWTLREYAQGFFRPVIKKHPNSAEKFLSKCSKSKNHKIRRFVSETLRPVQENRWFHKDPRYSLRVLKAMFKESAAYPRTSVGNNLSDLARQHPDLVYELVGKLVESGDKNSYWIAYRACRNLVKKEPVRVMDLLGIDEYKYKKRVHKRSEV